jgi:hypothetical protein
MPEHIKRGKTAACRREAGRKKEEDRKGGDRQKESYPHAVAF